MSVQGQGYFIKKETVLGWPYPVLNKENRIGITQGFFRKL